MKIRTIVDRKYGENCYIVSDEKNGVCVIIDPASLDVAASIGALNLNPVCVLLTHGHFDHISSLDTLLSAYNVPVYLHENDKELLSDGMKNASVLFEGEPTLSRVEPVCIADGEKIQVGELCFEAVHTPGHTSGCVCYFCGDAVFTGDTIFADGYGRTDLYSADYTQMVQTIKNLTPKLAGKTIYPGHGATRKF